MTNCNLQNDFLETFSDLGFDQLIDTPTHKGGNILDILLASSPELISSIDVKGENEVCKSDHFAIEFLLDIKICQKKKVVNVKYLILKKQTGMHLTMI